MTKDITAQDCFALLKLYEKVFAHLPTNGDYLGIFLQGWLVEWIGTHVNWAQYARETTQEQMM
jgi:transposase